MNKFPLVCWVSFFLLASVFEVTGQNVVNGRADLSGYNFDKGSFRLSGEWEFYWNKLLTPDDFSIDQKPEWITIPSPWQVATNHPALGFATYRIAITLPEEHHGISLFFPILNASGKIWVNGELVEETGRVSDDPEQYLPKISPTIISLSDYKKDFEVIIQVANFSYFSGGISSTPQVDRSSSLISRMNRSNGIENFFAGCLIAMFLYQLILYFLFHRGKPYLWLALICLGVALRALIVHGGSFLLPNLFPGVSWEVWKKMEFGSVYAIVAIFPLYVYHLFPDSAPKKPLYFFCSIAIGLCIVVLFTNQYTYGKLLEVSHLGLLLTFIFAIYSIGKAWRSGNEDARIILFGVLASFPFILAEILKNSIFIQINFGFMYLVELGVLVFLLFQVYLLANHYAKSYKNLEIMNLNLEKMVEDRTTELRTANTVKDRLLSVMSHDIKSPLNSLRGILQIYNKGAITKDEFGHFARHIEDDLSKTSILVENILYWTASQLKGLQVKIETFDLHLVIVENVQLFQTIAAGKKITLQHNAPNALMIKSDRNIINLALRNLISNAIKFSYEESEIKILVGLSKHSLTIQVQDSGVGMDELTLKTLLEPKDSVSNDGTSNEKGTGLGLILCRDYLQKAGGQLLIQSIIGKGSTFNIILPLH